MGSGLSLGMRLSYLVFVSVFLVVFPGEAQDGTDDPSAELKAQIEGLLRLAEDRSEFGMKQLMVAVSPMVLPDSMAWFSETFGPEKGKLLDEEYRAMTRDLDGLVELFFATRQENRTNVSVTAISRADDPAGTGLQRAALRGMKKPVTLYSVRMVEPGEPYGMHLWSFVRIDGRFYIAGKMRAGFADDVR